MLKIDIPMKVTMTNGDAFEIEFIGPKQLIEFERRFGCSAGLVVKEKPVRLEWLTFLAFESLRQRDSFAGDFDSFIGQLADLQIISNGSEPIESEESDDDVEEEPGKASAPGALTD